MRRQPEAVEAAPEDDQGDQQEDGGDDRAVHAHNLQPRPRGRRRGAGHSGGGSPPTGSAPGPGPRLAHRTITIQVGTDISAVPNITWSGQ